MTSNDLEPSQKGFQWIFRNIWMLRTFQYWTATKWLELDQDNLSMKFSALNVDFSSLSPDPLGSWSPAQAGVKDFKDFGLYKSISFTRWRHGTGVGGVA